MNKLIACLIILSFQNAFAWAVSSVGCHHQTDPNDTTFVSYTYVNLEAYPDAAATIVQNIELQNPAPNIGNGMTDRNQYGFYNTKAKVNPSQSLFGSNYDGFRLDGGTVFSQGGSIKDSRIEVTFNRRYSDGEPYGARVDIFTKARNETAWTLSEANPECSLSVYH